MQFQRTRYIQGMATINIEDWLGLANICSFNPMRDTFMVLWPEVLNI